MQASPARPQSGGRSRERGPRNRGLGRAMRYLLRQKRTAIFAYGALITG